MLFKTLLLSTLVIATSAAKMEAVEKKGCYSSAGSLKDQGAFTYQSPGYCINQCRKDGYTVVGLTHGSNCYCGKDMPSESDKVDDDKCDMACDGYPSSKCGGAKAWTIYATGSADVSTDDDETTTSGSATIQPTSVQTSILVADENEYSSYAPTATSTTTKIPENILTAPSSGSQASSGLTTKAASASSAAASPSQSTGAGAAFQKSGLMAAMLPLVAVML